ncbi:uncharacterized protein TDEL_0G03300 [Torulaspora delbrueckii]|uniref:Uncharacterized protein n=1 Tax=Torulaspora delbrueckii TaxID=4950 RepID=G8ZXT0_TORDE|nr:hypothetical protein TDEL_0G03300 [Torulaspora delbrueckii]CCE93697.1 hypothetical protein TDEL_0G03300 [Torulaspora delbrueckii]
MKLVLGLTFLELALVAQCAPLNEQDSSANGSISTVGLVTTAAEQQASASDIASSQTPATVYSFLGESGDASSAILQMPTSSSEMLASATSDSMDESSAVSQFLNGSGDLNSKQTATGRASSVTSIKSSGVSSASNSSSRASSHANSSSGNSTGSSSSTNSVTTSGGANKMGLPLVAGGLVAGIVALL